MTGATPSTFGVLTADDDDVFRAELGRELDGLATLALGYFAPPDEDFGRATLERVAADAVTAARALRPMTNLEALVLACTSGTFHGGRALDSQVRSQLRNASGVTAITASSAVVWMLHALGARSVAVLTPYPAWLSARLQIFLGEHGIDVRSCTRPDIADYRLGSLEGSDGMMERLIEACRSIDATAVDAIAISCTAWPTAAIVPAVESELGVPVVSSTSAIVRMLAARPWNDVEGAA